MSDEGRAGLAVVLWSIAFHSGIFIAAGISKPIGLMLMGCATAILIAILNADAKIEAEKRRRKRYQKNAEKLMQEAINHDD